MKLRTLGTYIVGLVLLGFPMLSNSSEQGNPQQGIDLVRLLQGHWHAVKARNYGEEHYNDIAVNWRGARQEYMIIGTRIHYVEYLASGQGRTAWGGSIEQIDESHVVVKVDFYMPYELRTVGYAKDGEASVFSGESFVNSKMTLKVRQNQGLTYVTGEGLPGKDSRLFRTTWTDLGWQRIDSSREGK